MQVSLPFDTVGQSLVAQHCWHLVPHTSGAAGGHEQVPPAPEQVSPVTVQSELVQQALDEMQLALALHGR